MKIEMPIHHILIIIKLADSLGNFLMGSKPYEPFGPGPWPCFNPACEHFNNKVIQSVELIIKPNLSVFYGVFKCCCEFTYLLDSIYYSNMNEFTNLRQQINIQNYGYVWKNKLRDLWISNVTVAQPGGRSLLGQ
jgi:hypothetical protein